MGEGYIKGIVYVSHFIRAFERLFEWRKENDKPLTSWNSGEEMFWWWMQEDRKFVDPDQGVMFE